MPQAWVLDRLTEERRRLSDEDLGVEVALVTASGDVVWWSAVGGGEEGRWVRTPIEGGIPAPLISDIPDGWSMGISFGGDAVAVGLATDDGYAVFVSGDEASTRIVYEHEQPAGVGRLWPEGSGGLSADGSMVCLRHTEHGDSVHPSLRVLDVRDGETIAELVDHGRALDPVAWSPVTHRLLFTSERGASERPAVWDPVSDTRTDIDVDIPGGLIPLAWYPDGTAVLVRQEHEAIDRLHRVDVDSGRAQLIADPGGEVLAAVVRPDGEVWLTVSDATHAVRPETSDGRVVIDPPGEPPPVGRPFQSYWFMNRSGERIQALVLTPEGEGPFPIVMHAHGGPEWHHRERWHPELQAFVDAGYAVAAVNFRGSTGYGIAFRERIVGDPLLPESEDIVACLDLLIAEGIADPTNAFLAGWSWGGCLACLNEGLHPDRWRAVFAGVPVGDLFAWHRSAMPFIRALNVATFGGEPGDLPELYRQRDPMTYVDRARAPVLVIAAEDDARCPLEAVIPWVEALRRRGVTVELVTYGGSGHFVNATDENVRQVERILDFFDRHRGRPEP